MNLPDRREPQYRIDLRFRGDRLLVKMDGPAGPDADRHLAEVRDAAAKCNLDVVVQYGPAGRAIGCGPSLRRRRRG